LLSALANAAKPYRAVSNKAVMALAAVAGYLLICLSLASAGFAKSPGFAMYLLLGSWVIGVCGLLLIRDRPGRFDAGALTIAKALWANLGLVFLAALLPMPVRLMVLFVPLFGVLYTALHLGRGHVHLVAGLTWLGNVVAVVALGTFAEVDYAIEAFVFGVFTLLLIAMVYMAGEVTALRVAFAKRREQLSDALLQLSDIAMRDELTGLYNRRYIMDVLGQQKALADRGHVGFTLCYCDLDHFKHVNDRFGHPRGDSVLTEFAAVADSVVRSMDYVARMGGEEFVLVLIGTGQREALNVATRLAERTRELSVGEDAPEFRLTVSTGVASYRVGERLEDVIQRADLALYRAKSGGRDQIILGT
jgi:diguanylate cyclase (GGDEF)-like protein